MERRPLHLFRTRNSAPAWSRSRILRRGGQCTQRVATTRGSMAGHARSPKVRMGSAQATKFCHRPAGPRPLKSAGIPKRITGKHSPRQGNRQTMKDPGAGSDGTQQAPSRIWAAESAADDSLDRLLVIHKAAACVARKQVGTNSPIDHRLSIAVRDRGH